MIIRLAHFLPQPNTEKKNQPKAAKKNFISRFDIHILDC